MEWYNNLKCVLKDYRYDREYIHRRIDKLQERVKHLEKALKDKRIVK